MRYYIGPKTKIYVTTFCYVIGNKQLENKLHSTTLVYFTTQCFVAQAFRELQYTVAATRTFISSKPT